MGFVRLFILFVVVYSALRSFRAFLGQVQAPPPRRPMGSQQQYQQQQWRQAPPPPRVHTEPRQPTPYEVLGVTPSATPQEIKHAYQTLVRQYHPDKVTDMGVELRELAERRTKEINAAYNQLKRG